MSLPFLANILALLFSFFVIGALLGAAFSKPFRTKIIAVLRRRRLLLAKSARNPILAPGGSPWTAEAVMNPAAVVLEGRTHLIYRAIGADGVSRLGYASSAEGIVFDTRLPYPAYVAQNPRNFPGQRRYSPVLYPSGGSWGGCEDPRAVVLGDRVYITFNMFDGWDFIRVAALSIARDDFIAHRFETWDGPYILSRPGERQKNWVLFPEKIRGKFAILHSITPDIEIAYRDSIEAIGTEEPFIESWVGARDGLPARENTWDSFIRSAGPPPLKTDRGWLLFYHAIDEHDPGRYKLGALLLDADDPTKVLHRATAPILSPDEQYENRGKPGIVYACGAVVRDGTLFVYYGGADKVVCVATAPLDSFLATLAEGNHSPSFELQDARTV
ncbi:MAG: glycoside hydrolase family 130 protein [Minisyncoccota bacterium]